jgi:hypothetical protein
VLAVLSREQRRKLREQRREHAAAPAK